MKLAIEALENLIRNGQFAEAEAQLRRIGKVDRKFALPVANIARRINRPSLAIKILNPIVRSENSHQEPATDLEKIEYAEDLRRVGAIHEAWDLLVEIDSDEHPQALVHQIFCLFNQWRYEESLPLLQRYIAHPKLNAYNRCVGKINLAAAFISVGDFEAARSLLLPLQEETKSSDFLLLYGNSLELHSQLLTLTQNYDEALQVLSVCSEILKGAGNVASLFVQKWTAIAQSLKQDRTAEELREVSLRAQNEKHWETVRDCDLYVAHLDRDFARFRHLYIGTPYESFRKRILEFAGAHFEAPENYLWSQNSNPQAVFDVRTGIAHQAKKNQLPVGQALHRLFILLSQDFYRPVSTLSAFSKLFPDEYMNANTSANRVHQIVKRSREWLRETDLDIQILDLDGSYQLAIGPKAGLMVPSHPLPMASSELEWLYFESEFSAPQFNIHQASEALSWSQSSTQRLLKWAVAEGRLLRQGKGSKTVYLKTS